MTNETYNAALATIALNVRVAPMSEYYLVETKFDEGVWYPQFSDKDLDVVMQEIEDTYADEEWRVTKVVK